MPRSPKAVIAKLARSGRGGLIAVEEASAALGVTRRTAALKLASLTRSGWLTRARRGLYLILPLESEPGRPTVAEDPWILANEAFSPCYIGGWSAAEHWGLTEQIFRSTLVVTGAKVRAKSARLLGQEFRLFQVPRHRITGVTAVWRGPERVPVSSAERTIVDCLRYPELSGGIRHLAQIMREYERSEKHDFGKLLAEAKRSANGAAWKRLGFLAESLWPDESALQAAARAHRSTGIVKLDAAAGDRGQILSRWRLRVNVDRKALTRET